MVKTKHNAINRFSSNFRFRVFSLFETQTRKGEENKKGTFCFSTNCKLEFKTYNLTIVSAGVSSASQLTKGRERARFIV